MTERLSALLRDEADALDIPPVDQEAILGRGRQSRARRRATVFLVAAAVVAIVGTGATVAGNGAGDPDPGSRAIDPAAEPAPPEQLAAYGAGSTVVVNRRAATIPDTLHSLHYTSVGVLARSNPNGGASDGSGPESLTLVADDGMTTDLGTIPEGAGPATDPDEPVYALAEKSGDGFEAVIRDALTGEELGSVPLPDLPMSYWPVPPLALDGDVVYAGFESEAVAYDWRTGESMPAKGVPGGIPHVHGGRTTLRVDGAFSVVDAATGELVLAIALAPSDFASGTLSPDGRFLRFKVEPMSDSSDAPPGLGIYEVDTGERVQLYGAVLDWGWSTGSASFRVTEYGIQVCDLTGACRNEVWPRVGQDLRYGGNSYES